MAEIKNKRNIILIGKTGNGKSTLANVLSGTDKFKESGSGFSQTQKIQTEDFEYEGIKYRIIDTPGICDTDLDRTEISNQIVEACYNLSGGINQALLVSRGKFTDEELEVYNFLKDVFFDNELTNYTTIVRTGFADFENEEECEKELEKIIKKPKLAELFKSCNKVIHIDNPAIPTGGRVSTIISAKELREESRKKILQHLTKECDNYYPVNLSRLVERISAYMAEKEKLEKELEELKKTNEESRKKVEGKIAELEAKIEEQTQKEFNNKPGFFGFLKNRCKLS